MKKKVRFINGYSESLWKSLVVKSVRIGWVGGLVKASQCLSPSTMKHLLICGLFEDVFPSIDLIHTAVKFVENGEYGELCKMQTHHGKGLADEFCKYEKEAVEQSKDIKLMLRIIYKTTPSLFVPQRVFNCYYTWYKMLDKIIDTNREPDFTPFTFMPMVMADAHTYEGKVLDNRVTFLSGFYYKHRQLGEIVMKEGWENLREQVRIDEEVPNIDPSPNQKT